MKQH